MLQAMAKLLEYAWFFQIFSFTFKDTCVMVSVMLENSTVIFYFGGTFL